MPSQPVFFSDQELEVIQEVKNLMGFETDEEAIHYLLSARLKERLLKLVGQELKSKSKKQYF
ncbi:hypothetical protein B9T36_02105 [Acinetobacter sp. ANC 4204]|uniref:hypothetical protein n=1 Tax=Acinetobacter sp. ANC 4204 TaxID=1977884 RepID=UPI000A33B14C|nr:hypothetical protein [Acinetobacter sp. ANC 4204]OTG61217.1 hypothetical protein B9T36_02105 [Acinetobacter sp. ANC 4204]